MRTPNLRWVEPIASDNAAGEAMNIAGRLALALDPPLPLRDEMIFRLQDFAAQGLDHAVEAQARPVFVMDPPMTPRDEMIFLLHIAAEVEHALLVQYLYAAFSIRQSDFPPGAPADAAELTSRWHDRTFEVRQLFDEATKLQVSFSRQQILYQQR